MIRPFVHFYTTKRCNSTCRHCFISALKADDKMSYEGELTTEQSIEAFKKLRNMGFEVVSLGGAEPTEKKEFNKIVKGISDLGYKIKLHTNGTNIDKECADILKDSGVFEVRISLDGSTPEINDFIRGKNAYDDSMVGIKNCINNGINTTLAVTVSKNNLDDIENIIDLSKDLGASALHSYLLVDKGRGIDMKQFIPEEDDLKIVNGIFEKKRQEYDLIKGIDPSECLCKDGTCYVGLKQNGDVYFYNDARAYYNIGVSQIGNIFDEDIEEKINETLVGQKLPDCQQCEHYANYMCAELDNYCFDDIKF